MLAKPFFVVGGVYCLNMSKLQALFSKVLIFCENKSDVDDVHEYLLLKAVEARENSGSFTSLPAWPTIDHGWNQTHPNHFGGFFCESESIEPPFNGYDLQYFDYTHFLSMMNGKSA